MRLFLAIDASTYVGSCALFDESGALLGETAAAMRDQREERLMPAMISLLESTGTRAGDLSGVICGEGPGSFTSLRIAASIAKGMCHGLQLPLYPVSSLLLIAAAARPPLPAGEYLAMLDAMRGELHVIRCAVGGDAVPVLRGTLELKSRDELSAVMRGDDPHLIGIGPDCARRLEPHARGAATVIGAILAGGPADLDTWEPRYGRMAEAEVRLARTNHGVTA